MSVSININTIDKMIKSSYCEQFSNTNHTYLCDWCPEAA